MNNFRFTKNENIVKIYGKIDEFSDFTDIVDNKDSCTYLDVSGVHNINSNGIRSWVSYFKNYKGKIIFKNCPIPVTEQFSMVPEFLGVNSWVENFYALFYCSECDNEELQLLNIGSDINRKTKDILKTFTCKFCLQSMEPDFDQDEYFLFLEDLVELKEEPPTDDTSSKDEPDLDSIIRKPLKTRVSLFDEGSNRSTLTTFSENIGEQGIFICSHITFPVGSRFEVEFKLPLNSGAFVVRNLVEVRWIREENSLKNIIPGLGVQFVDLEKETAEKIKEYIESFIKQE